VKNYSNRSLKYLPSKRQLVARTIASLQLINDEPNQVSGSEQRRVSVSGDDNDVNGICITRTHNHKLELGS